ncbi:MAG: hypothetical protein CVV64_00825 [Candidatus Wallbacteria bacterium HGW-Wallbacteria-1]|jgi:tRNA nucleotidyltransferase (CCA-adding enzyme)|uniref:CBS domain-containing protein n=1 Tax=Candidatus Wallbacteria bacterium HGW-Wallbacteria-1 TaxID=2013854 RepID=A0A2N1PUI6_9BACT|nr:MAG: hypothetical protein CVV64_00825 [Candidatus Wallbacteria bacterium HGW-Wallbacteria-1]
MEYILSHSNVDFDGLASMVAASLLNPGARMVQPPTQERSVRNFLTLYRHTLEMTREKYVDLADVTRIIVVDTCEASKAGRLGVLFENPSVVKTVYDHHPPRLSPDEASAMGIDIHYEALGSTVTQLIEMLQHREIPVSSFTATVLALGIYDDTGSLTYTTTTARDLHAAAWLVDHGASLSFIQDFIRPQLSYDQLSLLNRLIARLEHHVINGVRVSISTENLDEFVGDMAVIAHKMRDLENISVLFLIVRMGNRIHLIGRSRLEGVDISRIASHFGGGGHPTAASAVIRDDMVESVHEKLVAVLKEHISLPRVARDLMTTPVKTVDSLIPLTEAKRIMLYFNINGLPVVNDRVLQGIITRSDIDKAIHHNLAHAPVKGFMTNQVITVGEEASIYDVKRKLLSNSIGRLPVVDSSGEIKGIITGTDLLRMLHDDLLSEPYSIYDQDVGLHLKEGRSLDRDLLARVPGDLLELLGKAGEIAASLSMRLFAVGGFVRDMLMSGNENVDLGGFRPLVERDGSSSSKVDVDLVVEGNGIVFAQAMARELGGQVKTHGKFKTATLSLDSGFILDIATARFEYYEFPAALPMVEAGSIRHDLYRRDFSVNAMALAMGGDDFGRLLDYFGGQDDIHRGLIRVLHNLSFVEDPTRIFRAVRFASRFGFRIEERTDMLIRSAIDLGVMERISGFRLFNEIILILRESNASRACELLSDYNVLQLLDPRLRASGDYPETFAVIDRFAGRLCPPSLLNETVLRARFLSLWDYGVSIDQTGAISIPRHFRKDLENLGPSFVAVLERLLEMESSPSRIYRSLEKITLPAILWLCVLAWIRSPDQGATALERSIAHIQGMGQFQPLVTGTELVDMGVARGPEVGRVLNRIMDDRLDGKVNSRKDEEELVRRIISDCQDKWNQPQQVP